MIMGKKKNRKEIADITIDFLNAKKNRVVRLDTTKLTHPLGERVIYMCDSDIDYQELGNLGAIPVNRFDPYDTYYICLTERAYDSLMFGIKDSFLFDIEHIYNTSKREIFTYKFLLETDLKAFIKFRKEEEFKIFSS